MPPSFIGATKRTGTPCSTVKLSVQVSGQQSLRTTSVDRSSDIKYGSGLPQGLDLFPELDSVKVDVVR